MDSPTSLKKREPGIALAANFTANNRWAALLTHNTHPQLGNRLSRAGTRPLPQPGDYLHGSILDFYLLSRVSYLLIVVTDTAFRHSTHSLRLFLPENGHKNIRAGSVSNMVRICVKAHTE